MNVLNVIDHIQELSPCAAVRYRTQKMLKQQFDPELFEEFYNSKWVELLKTNQHGNGGYGRFHSKDSKLKQKFPTTERAVDSIKMLGMQRGNDLVDKLCDYMEKVLKHEIVWPDGYESNRWYRSAQPLFVSSKLSTFGSDCKEHIQIFDCWHTILNEAFSEGSYSSERTNAIAKELLGCDIAESYIGLNSIYPIELFANMQEKISDDLKLNYLKWLHHSGKKIYYTGIALDQKFDSNYSEMFKVYYLLSKFSCFKTEFKEELKCLKNNRSPEGFWNFGRNFSCQRLSDDWRSQDRMKMDHTIMALLLFT